MLTTKHLAVIRAALHFWDEEMSPYDPEISAGYFEEPMESGEWIKEAVALLRDRFSECQLQYGLCSPEEASLVSDQLFDTLEAAQAAIPQDAARIASVLIFAERG